MLTSSILDRCIFIWNIKEHEESNLKSLKQ